MKRATLVHELLYVQRPRVVRANGAQGLAARVCPGGLLTYIGRPGKWGNPFVIGRDGDRDEVIEQFRVHLLSSPLMIEDLPQLTGQMLGCFCKPEPCHGDVLVEAWTWLVLPRLIEEALGTFSHANNEALWGEDAPLVQAAIEALYGQHPSRGGSELASAAFAVVQAVKAVQAAA